jgi:catechol 2,3-dioxygenase-like lactoylglutathione lyase family enzyme
VTRVLFDHIAIAVPRIADALPFLVGELGGAPAHGGPSGAYTFGQWRFAGGGVLEILEPLGADGFLHRFLAQRGPGIHHVTFRVPGLRLACDRAEAAGYTIVGHDDSNPEWQEAFLHPKQALGIVVQLAASEPAPRGARRPCRWAPPPGPASPPPPVTVVGLRMGARSRERALAQWGGVLQGDVRDGAGGEIVFGWPGSPMRIVVEIDPEGDEGPRRVEVWAERPIALPSGPHPVLGAAFGVSGA